MLGTGSALVTRCYNTCFVIDAGEGNFLVDAGGGNGILAQFEKAGIEFGSLHYAFLTHGHTDHILGMIWVVRRIAQLVYAGDYEGTFTVYGHDEAIEMLDTFCRMVIPSRFYKYIGNRILLSAVSDGEEWEAAGASQPSTYTRRRPSNMGSAPYCPTGASWCAWAMSPIIRSPSAM